MAAATTRPESGDSSVAEDTARRSRQRPNQQVVELVGLSVALAALATVIVGLLPNIDGSLRPSELWAVLAIGIGFGASLLTVWLWLEILA